MTTIKQHLITAKKEINKALTLLEPSPDPEPDPLPEKDDRLHFGGTFFLWFLYKAWKIENQAEVIDEARRVLARFASFGYSVDEALGWIWSGRREHRHLDGKCPWKKKLIGSGANLKKNELRYYQLLRTFISLHREVGIEVEYCIIMRDDYTRKAIRWYDESKWNYLRALGRNVCRMYREAYKDINYKPMIKIANELMHGGSTSTWHKIGRFHSNIANHLMDRGDTTIDKIKADLSLSEAGQIFLNEPLVCGRVDCNLIHGDPRFDRADPKNSILVEKHGYSCIENISSNPEALHWLGSKWKRYEFSGDGGAHPRKAHGFCVPGTPYCQGNAEETKELVKYFMRECKRYKKHGVYCLWLMEIYSEKTATNNNWKEHWEMAVIDWKRVEATAQTCKEIKR